MTTTDDSFDSMNAIIDFESSEIGTKEYWDSTYTKELENFDHHGDIGDIWFGEDSVLRVINWIVSQINSAIRLEDAVLDIGCGNGIILSYLIDEGFKNVYGIDYSESAVCLAKAVAEKRETNITYEVGDIVSGECSGNLLSKHYKICHDKGTYDAISLCPEVPKSKMESYIRNVYRILEPDGLLIISSCNWTEDELVQHFDKYFVRHATIPTPVFSFGGKIGSKYTSVVLRKI